MMRFLFTLLATLALTTPAAAQSVTKTDEQWASEGELVAYASPWCRWLDKGLVAGRDYANSMSWQQGAMAAGVQITWRWPAAAARKPTCGVFGYNHVAWGNYDGGATMKPVPPRRVDAIDELTFSYGVDYASDPSSFNGLAEFYLTRAAGQSDQKAVEVGFFWQAPASTQLWARTCRQLGVFTDRWQKRWNAATCQGGAAPFVVFIPPAGAQLWGQLDALGALTFLRAKGQVDGAWWFNGAAIGVEPLGGFGTAIVRRWAPTYR